MSVLHSTFIKYGEMSEHSYAELNLDGVDSRFMGVKQKRKERLSAHMNNIRISTSPFSISFMASHIKGDNQWREKSQKGSCCRDNCHHAHLTRDNIV